MTSKKSIQLASLILIGFNLWVWLGIFLSAGARQEKAVYFLDVGQGDSQLITLGANDHKIPIRILIDGGRSKKVLEKLDTALGRQNNKYLDIIMMTHPDVDHFGGFIDIVKRYDIGLFISNGQTDQTEAFRALEQALAERQVPQLVLGEGDAIHYRDSNLSIISPDEELAENQDNNQASLVAILETAGTKTLFTGDAGATTEKILLDKNYDLKSDILKVGHHGSKNSSSENFVAAVQPLVSTISVGKNNYGHPTPRVLETLQLAGNQIYRTDENGTIKIVLNESAPPNQTKFLAAVGEIMTGRYKNPAQTVLWLSQLKTERSEISLESSHPPEKESDEAALEQTPAGHCLATQININTAPQSDLVKIRHVGEVRAAGIIANRPFSSVAELRSKVNGIGASRLQDIINEGLACAE